MAKYERNLFHPEAIAQGLECYSYFVTADAGMLSVDSTISESTERPVGYCSIALDIAALAENLRQLLPSSEDCSALLRGDALLCSSMAEQELEQFKERELPQESLELPAQQLLLAMKQADMLS